MDGLDLSVYVGCSARVSNVSAWKAKRSGHATPPRPLVRSDSCVFGALGRENESRVSGNLAGGEGLRPLAIFAGYQQKVVQAYLYGLFTDRAKLNANYDDVATQVGAKLLLNFIFVDDGGGG